MIFRDVCGRAGGNSDPCNGKRDATNDKDNGNDPRTKYEALPARPALPALAPIDVQP